MLFKVVSLRCQALYHDSPKSFLMPGVTAPVPAGAYNSWEGMAPSAKLAFTDIGSGTSGSLSVPSDLYSDYFPYSYQ